MTYIVDRSGVISASYFEEDYKRRITTGAILSEAAPGVAGSVIRNQKLEITASASDTTVRGGERVRLFLRVKLQPGLHVYAPGVEGYIPIDWKVSPGPVEPLATQYPQSRVLYLKAINEKVPVYEKEFTLTRDVVVFQARELEKFLDGERKVNVEGTFRYQACDDTKCYIPEDVSLRWTFQFEAHDSTRVPAELRRK